MKGLGKSLIPYVVISLMMGGVFSEGWSQEKVPEGQQPVNDGKAFLDLVVARPVGFVVGLVGVGVFIATLPFTVPTGSADDAAKFLIVRPFRFSFGRKFPDENLR